MIDTKTARARLYLARHMCRDGGHCLNYFWVMLPHTSMQLEQQLCRMMSARVEDCVFVPCEEKIIDDIMAHMPRLTKCQIGMPFSEGVVELNPMKEDVHALN